MNWWRGAVAVVMLLVTWTPARAQTGDWLPGPDATGDNTIIGFIDQPQSGATLTPNSNVYLQGWVVDQSASGWTGVDDVQVYIGQIDQGGTLVAHANTGIRRDDVAAAFGNPYWATAGFTLSFAQSGLSIGPNVLTIYAHTPNRGSWYKQIQVQVPAPPDRPYADDPLLIVRQVVPSSGVNELDIDHTVANVIVSGYAIDRNMPTNLQLGVGGSGVSTVQFYLDGARNGGGTLLGSATLGQQNREATGFGGRFLNSGWQMTIHPSQISQDRHEFYIYADSAFWFNEALVIIPFVVV
jgi:hypothetical protein